MGCFLDDLKAFGYQRRPVDDCSSGRGGMAQNSRTRGGTFHGEMDRCRETQDWTTACSGMPGRDGKDQEDEDNIPKQAGSCWFASPCRLATSGANLYPPGIWFADVMPYFSGVAFVLFCFVFVSMLLLKPRPFVQSSFDMQAPRLASRVSFFVFSPLVYLEMSLFPSICLYHFRFLFVWRVRRTFFPSR